MGTLTVEQFEGNGRRWEREEGHDPEVYSTEVSWTHDRQLGRKGTWENLQKEWEGRNVKMTRLCSKY